MAKPFARILEHGASFAVLFLLMTYAYANLFQDTYFGFRWTAGSGKVIEVFPPNTALHVGDRLVRVDGREWQDFVNDLHHPLIEDAFPGRNISIELVRDGETQIVAWTLPGFNLGEFDARVTNQWWMALILWIVGESVLLYMRPRDVLYRVLISFNFLTALWIGASAVSRDHLFSTPVVMRMAMWLCVPVYLHLNWLVPTRLGSLPQPIWWALYGSATLLALAEWPRWLPTDAYVIGMAIALVGSLVLLVAHLFRKQDRATLLPVAVIVAGGFLPILAATVWYAAAGSEMTAATLALSASALFTLPLIPLAYLYIAYRRRLADLEIRRNPVGSIYLFILLLNTAALIFGLFLIDFLALSITVVLTWVVVVAASSLITIVGYPVFRKFLDKQLFHIKIPAEEIAEQYVSHITGSLNEKNLIAVLRDELMPGFSIHQSALVLLNDHELVTLYCAGVEASQLPSRDQIDGLKLDAGRPRGLSTEPGPILPWVRLVLPIAVNNNTIGLWLLGRHDPDDYYTRQEISELQKLAHQTAIAVVNIQQAAQLRSLYQGIVAQREAERASLAHELHDVILREAGRLKELAANSDALTPEFAEHYDRLAASLRQTIVALRPAELKNGIWHAIKSLVEDLSERREGLAAYFDVPRSRLPVLHDGTVVLNLYRIVQEACENALRHAQATEVRIGGAIAPERIEICVEDNGCGFEVGRVSSLAPDRQKHFGLIDMRERADMIGAEFSIVSGPGVGTRVRVIWQK